jgi:hypothetical protein
VFNAVFFKTFLFIFIYCFYLVLAVNVVVFVVVDDILVNKDIFV